MNPAIVHRLCFEALKRAALENLREAMQREVMARRVRWFA